MGAIKMANILIIDDDVEICNVLTMAIERMNHAVRSAATLQEGLSENRTKHFDVVFLDVDLPDGNGLEALPRIKESASSPEVIIITGKGDPDGAELAIKSGAWDYLQKAPSMQALDLQLNRALRYREEKFARQQQSILSREEIIGNSLKLKQCLDLVLQAAQTDINVLISGETGTGKELFANAIHKNSSLRNNNFVIVDCATLPETLVESILFGHEKGAFTGADKTQQGLISQADGGTLFLDEVGELPLFTQKAFLRVLQEHRFRPVGAKTESTSHFRLVAATNRDLDRMAEEGQFRQDLLYRLRSITIDLPPLRKRTADVLEIAMYYTTKYCNRNDAGIKGFSPEFIEALRAYHWPGNVRELINSIESALSEAGDEPTLIPRHLPTLVRAQLAKNSVTNPSISSVKTNAADPDPILGRFRDFKDAVVMDAEKQYLQKLMKLTRHNIKEACQIADLSRARLYALLKKHRLSGTKENPENM
jgi:two-component system, NtrC family, response regulator